MSKLSKLLGATAIAAALAVIGTAAQATPIVVHTPIVTPPPVINATGDVTAIYVFSDAADHSTLDQTAPPPGNPLIFANNSTNNPGDTLDLGNQAGLGPIVFSLHDLTVGNNFLSNTPDAAGDYHAVFSQTYTDFNEGAVPLVVQNYINGLPGGTVVTFVGWEDRTGAQGSDFDYNDLIFAFTNICVTNCNPSVPEPVTLSLFGAGLVGAAALRRRRKSNKTA